MKTTHTQAPQGRVEPYMGPTSEDLNLIFENKYGPASGAGWGPRMRLRLELFAQRALRANGLRYPENCLLGVYEKAG